MLFLILNLFLLLAAFCEEKIKHEEKHGTSQVNVKQKSATKGKFVLQDVTNQEEVRDEGVLHLDQPTESTPLKECKKPRKVRSPIGIKNVQDRVKILKSNVQHLLKNPSRKKQRINY